MWTFQKEYKSIPTKYLLLIQSLLLFLLVLSQDRGAAVMEQDPTQL